MKIGNNDVTKLYIGDTEVTKAYMGDTVIWDPTPTTSTIAKVRGTLTSDGNFAVSEAVNSDRIGAFRWYQRSYNWDTSDVYDLNATSGQLRFGPAVAWTYNSVSIPAVTGVTSTSQDWEDQFALSDLTLRITCDGQVSDFPAIPGNDEDFNNQTGYVIIPNTSVAGWNWPNSMDITYEFIDLT